MMGTQLRSMFEPATIPSLAQQPLTSEGTRCMSTLIKVQMPDVILPPRPPPPVLPPEDPERDDPNEPDYKPPLIPPSPVLNRSWDQRTLHMISWVGLAADGKPAAEERLKAEFDVAHPHNAFDGALRSSPASARMSAIAARRWPFCASIRSSSRVWSSDGFSARQRLICWA